VCKKALHKRSLESARNVKCPFALGLILHIPIDFLDCRRATLSEKVEVFYASSGPEQQTVENQEYYTLTYKFVPPVSFVVMQIHGWWDEISDCSRRHTTVLATVDAEAEAKRIHGEQRGQPVAQGVCRLRLRVGGHSCSGRNIRTGRSVQLDDPQLINSASAPLRYG
jgi:hypothetical protein